MWVVLEDVSELRRLQQIRTEFVDNLSHELRTPLSTVSLLAETLARDAEAAGDGVPPRMRDRIDKIEVETGHLVQMVNELLDLARIEGGGPLVLLDDVDLGRVATDAAERLRLFAERQGLRLVVDVADRLPPIRGDESRLGQVVVNLVHNAAEVRAGGGSRRRTDGVGAAAVRPDRRAEPDPTRCAWPCAAADGEVQLSVEDHGVGIPAADQARIFERFYKVDRVRVRGGGTGLGLAIARHVIEQHGGRIRVESEEGSGSTFTVSLPVARRRGRPPRLTPTTATLASRAAVVTLGAMDRLHVATLNILNLADRWDERLPLILADMAALQPDVLGLQEVGVRPPAGPADRRGRRRALRDRRAAGPAGRSTATRMLVREPLVAVDAERLDLGLGRSAVRARHRPGGRRERDSRP